MESHVVSLYYVGVHALRRPTARRDERRKSGVPLRSVQTRVPGFRKYEGSDEGRYGGREVLKKENKEERH